MNTAQKIVKYCAVAFAFFLSVVICSTIAYAIVGIATATKLIETHSAVETKCESAEERCLQINLAYSELIIKKGDELKVDTKNDKVEVNEDGKKLVITEKGRHLFEKFSDRDVVVYIPEDMEFEKVAIAGGAGSTRIESLRAKKLEVALGIGETRIEALETEDAKIDTGIGEVRIGLMSKADEYEIHADKGIGEVRFNGRSVSDHSVIGNGSRKIKVDGGIGSITIDTVED